MATPRKDTAYDVPIDNRSPGGAPQLRVVAQNIALTTGNRALILVGLLDGPKGLPQEVSEFADRVELRMLDSYTKHFSTGIFEIKDEDALCSVIDHLQENGSYRATVINLDGSIDPAYTF